MLGPPGTSRYEVPNLFRKIKHGNFTLPGFHITWMTQKTVRKRYHGFKMPRFWPKVFQFLAGHLSSEAKDLIVQMLVVDPTRRNLKVREQGNNFLLMGLLLQSFLEQFRG